MLKSWGRGFICWGSPEHLWPVVLTPDYLLGAAGGGSIASLNSETSSKDTSTNGMICTSIGAGAPAGDSWHPREAAGVQAPLDAHC